MTLDHETVRLLCEAEETMRLLCEVVDGRVAVFKGTLYRQPRASTEAWRFTEDDYHRLAQLMRKHLVVLAPGSGDQGMQVTAIGDGHLAVSQYRWMGGQW
jgi:hypothetical protein